MKRVREIYWRVSLGLHTMRKSQWPNRGTGYAVAIKTGKYLITVKYKVRTSGL